MDMSIEQPAAPGGKIRAISTYLYRKPTLYLLLLLVPPLLWFGAVYLGSLLTLLWQGFYTFDDFTMTVTPESDLCQPERAVQPGQLRHHRAYADHGSGGFAGQCGIGIPNRLLHGPLYQRQGEGVLLYRRDDADVGQLHR